MTTTRTTKRLLAAALAFATLLGSGAALADGRGHGHGGGGVRWGLGISIGIPWYAYGPQYIYPPPRVYYPTVVLPAVEPVYIDRPVYIERSVERSAPPLVVVQPQAAAPSQGDWFYCAGSGAYYPYVSICPGGWQRVPSTPPGISR